MSFVKFVFGTVVFATIGIVYAVHRQRENERFAMRRRIILELAEEKKAARLQASGNPKAGSKTLNPADKARKEARKKELKKNKKQRQQVRSAAIESKDPEQILADLESLDKLEFDIDSINNPDYQPGGSNDLLFKEKRKRLKELWTKVISYYQKEDPEKYANLKKLEAQYEASHKKIERDFDAVKAAQEVTIEDVFLPPETDVSTNPWDEISDDDPLMSKSIYITPDSDGTLKAPGCPPGPPPDFKQLVGSLKSSIVAPPTFVAQTIPHNFVKLGISPKSDPKSFDRKGRSGEKQHLRSHGNSSKSNYRTGESESKRPSATNTEASSSTKSAVIESKPVIFMQKATKFVPASVRAKVNKTG